MSFSAAVAVVLLVASGGLPAAQGAASSTLEVVAKRFLRPGGTLVDVFCNVPFDFLSPVATGGGEPEAVYRVEVGVQDSVGTVLHQSNWSQSVGHRFLGIAGASTMEHLAFSVTDGSYTLSVSVTDSASGRVRRSSIEFVPLSSENLVSDLLLSGSMRRAFGQEATAGPGEIRKGDTFLSGTAKPVLTPRQADLFYYLELYPAQETTVEISAQVEAISGSTIIATAPEELHVTGSGGVAARSLSLAGLPQGEYVLRVTARFPDREVVRTAAFAMAGFETEADLAEVTGGPAVTDPFAQLTEDRLDSLYAPLMLIADADERRIYEKLSVSGKRNYLRQFWDKRDPTPGTPDNEYRDAYYRLFAEANRRFRESGAGDVPGWRTDRGRIFLRRGPPEEVLQRPQGGMTPPFEVWKYTRPRPLKYVFLDETGFGSFALIYTDDRFETSRPDWEALLGAQALEEVLRF